MAVISRLAQGFGQSSNIHDRKEMRPKDFRISFVQVANHQEFQFLAMVVEALAR